MFRLNTKKRRALQALAQIAVPWSAQASAQPNCPSTQFVNTANWDFGMYEIATQ